MQQLPEMGTGQLALGNGRGRPRKTPHASAEVQDHRGKKIGRPRKSESQQKKAINSYWASMTPEERSKEMKRRQKVSAKRGGKMVGFGVTKRKLSAKSTQAVAGTLDELRLKQRRERDRLRHQALRTKQKAAAKAQEAKQKAAKRGGISMSERPTKPGMVGRNGHPLITAEERAAKQKIYVQRSTMRSQGIPESEWPPLPSKPADTGPAGTVQ
jgi:hypothetical protein